MKQGVNFKNKSKQVNMKVPQEVHFEVRRLTDYRNVKKQQGEPRTTIHEVYIDCIRAGLEVLEQ